MQPSDKKFSLYISIWSFTRWLKYFLLELQQNRSNTLYAEMRVWLSGAEELYYLTLCRWASIC